MCQSNPSVTAQTRKLRLTNQYRKQKASNRDVASIRYSAVQEKPGAQGQPCAPSRLGAILTAFRWPETLALIDHTGTPTL